MNRITLLLCFNTNLSPPQCLFTQPKPIIRGVLPNRFDFCSPWLQCVNDMNRVPSPPPTVGREPFRGGEKMEIQGVQRLPYIQGHFSLLGSSSKNTPCTTRLESLEIKKLTFDTSKRIDIWHIVRWGTGSDFHSISVFVPETGWQWREKKLCEKRETLHDKCFISID